MWDPSFDISAHNRLCFLLEDDVARLKICDEDRLRHDVESLLGQAIALVSLFNIGVEEHKRTKGKKTQQIAQLQKENEHLQAQTVEVNRLRLELVTKTQEGHVLTREKTDLANKVNMLEKKMGDREQEMARKEAELQKMIDTLKDYVTQSYVVGRQL